LFINVKRILGKIPANRNLLTYMLEGPSPTRTQERIKTQKRLLELIINLSLIYKIHVKIEVCTSQYLNSAENVKNNVFPKNNSRGLSLPERSIFIRFNADPN
jgi:hypothetical protein